MLVRARALSVGGSVLDWVNDCCRIVIKHPTGLFAIGYGLSSGHRHPLRITPKVQEEYRYRA